MLVCATKEESEMLTILNVRTDLTGNPDDLFDFELSVSSSVIHLNKETVETEVLQYLSYSEYSIESLRKYPPVKTFFLDIVLHYHHQQPSKDNLALQVTFSRQQELHYQIKTLKLF